MERPSHLTNMSFLNTSLLSRLQKGGLRWKRRHWMEMRRQLREAGFPQSLVNKCETVNVRSFGSSFSHGIFNRSCAPTAVSQLEGWMAVHRDGVEEGLHNRFTSLKPPKKHSCTTLSCKRVCVCVCVCQQYNKRQISSPVCMGLFKCASCMHREKANCQQAETLSHTHTHTHTRTHTHEKEATPVKHWQLCSNYHDDDV